MLSTVPGTVVDTEEYMTLFLPSRSLGFSLEYRQNSPTLKGIKYTLNVRCQINNNG